MTALMFSLTLGFIIFLNIVCRIPFYNEFNDVAKSVGHRSITLNRQNQPQQQIDSFLRKFAYAIEQSGSKTNNLYNMNNEPFYDQRTLMSFDRQIDNVQFSDLARSKSHQIGVIGVSPTYPESLESQFVHVKKHTKEINHSPEDNFIFDKGGLSLG